MPSYLELKRQADELLLEVEAARKLEIETILRDLKEKATYFGLTLQDFKAAGVPPGNTVVKPPAAAAPPKYKGPNGELWSGGRGRKPDWALKVIREKGAPALAEYRIKN